MLKKLFRYSTVPNEDLEAQRAGETGSEYFRSALTGSSNLCTERPGLSYESIFTYSKPGSGGDSGAGFTEYWRPTNYSVTNESHNGDDENFLSTIVWLFVNPPFATSDKKGNRSAISTSMDQFFNGMTKIGRHIVWTVIFILFGTAWLVFFPFHWYWTLNRVRLNEAIVVFRVGQPPVVRKKAGSVVCLWPMMDRMYRVSLSRRGFSVPPTQIGLNDTSVVRLGAEISFHIVDPLRFVRMSCDTASSIRHIVHGQFISFLASQPLENLQRFPGGVQTELRSLCSKHLAQFGVFVDTFVLSQLEIVRQPSDPGQELIKSVLQAISGSGSGSPASSLGSVLSSLTPVVPPTMGAKANLSTVNESEAEVEKATDSENSMASKFSQFLSEALHNISSEARTSMALSPDAVFRLTIGKNHSWLLYPYTGYVDGPMKPSLSNHGMDKEKGSLYVSDWDTLDQLRTGNMSPLAASLSGSLSVSGDAIALASLFDPSKL